VLFHAGLGVPGGYIGVDVFFVISGFLITGLIVKDLKTQSFSLLDFWERRARRILPALAVVTAATLIAGWFLLMPSEFKHLGSSVIALAALASNIQFWRSSGYFAPASEEMPLLHTWSLSLEEQFYLLVPLFLMLLFYLRKSSWIRTALIGVSIGSLIMATIGLRNAPSATFYLLPFRAWELAIGSLLAITQPLKHQQTRSTLAWIGLVGILVPYALYSSKTPFPGPSAIPPVVGAAFLIWTGMPGLPATLPNRILAVRPLVWIGLLSYSLYLWHWPLFAYYRYVFSSSLEPLISESLVTGPKNSSCPTAVPAFLIVSVSFLLAWLSLQYVERPFRSKTLVRSRKLLFGLSLATVFLLVLPSVVVWSKHGLPERLSPEALRQANGRIDSAFIKNLTVHDIPENMQKLGIPGPPPCMLIWGDSHAMAILPAVDAACKDLGITATAATASLTAPVFVWYKNSPNGLNIQAPAYNKKILNYLHQCKEQGHPIRLVLLAAMWVSYLNPPEDARAFGQALERTVDELQKEGVQVAILKQVPYFDCDVPKSLFLYQKFRLDSLKPERSLIQYVSLPKAKRTIDFFAEFERQHPEIQFIDPLPFLMDSASMLVADDGMSPIYRDAHHLSVHGSMRIKDAFEKLIARTCTNHVHNRTPVY
jgi:peptidoglycan/LPS O-acetylase OafA/YrhL